MSRTRRGENARRGRSVVRDAPQENRSVEKVIRRGTGGFGGRRAGMSYVREARCGRNPKPPRPRPGRR